jgi:hypothetical protein
MAGSAVFAGAAASLAGAAGGSIPAQVPSEEAIDASLTLPELRNHEAAILTATRAGEDALARLQTLYKKVRAKMYRDHKLAVIAEDNAKLQQFQGGCPKPKEASLASKEELDRQADCLQKESSMIDNSDIGLQMRRHLQLPVAPLPAGAVCAPFRQVDMSQLSLRTRTCLGRAGDARWTAEGLVDAPPATIDGAAPGLEGPAAKLDGARALPTLGGGAGIGAYNGSSSASPSASECGRRWVGTAETRCLLGSKNLVFFGNSVVRRQMYTLLDLLAGPAAHRQLTNFTDVEVPTFKDANALARSWIWDQDNMTRGYHASQLFTVDLTTGEHRFSMPHTEPICGLKDSHSVFNPGRLHQWRDPGGGGGSEPILGNWRSTKWAGREWRPLVSFRLLVPAEELAAMQMQHAGKAAMQCGLRTLSWAGSHPDGVLYVPPGAEGIAGGAALLASSAQGTTERRRRRRGGGGGGGGGGGAGAGATAAEGLGSGLATRVRARLLRELEAFFSTPEWKQKLGEPHHWMANVSVHYEEEPADRYADAGAGSVGSALSALAGGLRRRRRQVFSSTEPNAWLYFPTYHGERESFNGFCEDKACECTGKIASCARHPECRGRHVCKPFAPGSAIWVEAARAFQAALGEKSKLLGYGISRPKLTPFYDDCWAFRGRCQGHRPCREPVDQAWTCRATAMLCVGRTWADALASAKSWIPTGHPSMSMLYLYDGQTSELLDETFRTWGPQVGGFNVDPAALHASAHHGAPPFPTVRRLRRRRHHLWTAVWSLPRRVRMEEHARRHACGSAHFRCMPRPTHAHHLPLARVQLRPGQHLPAAGGLFAPHAPSRRGGGYGVRRQLPCHLRCCLPADAACDQVCQEFGIPLPQRGALPDGADSAPCHPAARARRAPPVTKLSGEPLPPVTKLRGTTRGHRRPRGYSYTAA